MKSLSSIALRVEPPRTVECPEHGEYQSQNFVGRIWSRCPGCSAAEAAKEKVDVEAFARAEKQAAWAQRVGASGIPERFQNRSLQSFVATTPEQAQALEFAGAYADGFDEVLKTGRCAMFVGGPGTGKTHLAAGIGLRLMRRDHRVVLFTTVVRAIRSVKDTWARGAGKSEAQAVAALVYPDLLILDEVGVQFGSDTEKLILFDVLNERYEKRKPTLLMSNLGIDEVRAYLGERIFDRLREDGGEAVAFDWESYRGREVA